LTERAGKQLSLEENPVDPARLEALISQMAETKELIIEQGYGDLAEGRICYAPAFYHTEVAVLCQEGLPDCHKDAKAAKVWLNLLFNISTTCLLCVCFERRTQQL
jgi:hypothetical protein